MNLIPLTISICIATTISIYTAQIYRQHVVKLNSQAATDGFERAVKSLSPQLSQTQCQKLNTDFATHFPASTNWRVDINNNGNCGTAELSITLPDGNDPNMFFSSVANAKIVGQTTRWGLALTDPISQQIPYYTKLQATQAQSNTCNSYACTGYDRIHTRPIPTIFSNPGAFAALKADGKVVTWGHSDFGGDSARVASDLVDVEHIAATGHIAHNKGAFSALKADGTVVAWGHSDYGGDYTTNSSVSSSLSSKRITHIYATQGAFAAVSDKNRVKTITTWGDCNYGKVSGFYSSTYSGSGDLADMIDTVYTGQNAFAALLENDKVITWGGGCTMQSAGNSSGVASQLTNIKAIYPAPYSFCALTHDGKVICWGQSLDGYESLKDSQLASDIVDVVPTIKYGAYAALKSNGSVVTWGSTSYGGDSSKVSSALSSGVNKVVPSAHAFAARKPRVSGGSTVVIWGYRAFGGRAYNHTVSGSLSPVDNNQPYIKEFDEEIVDIVATDYAFATLSDQGNVATWGLNSYGGKVDDEVASQLINIKKIVPSKGAFAAVTDSGGVITWGHEDYGGDSSHVSNLLSSNIVQVYANDHAFVAFKADGTVVTWGHPSYGGDSSGVDFN